MNISGINQSQPAASSQKMPEASDYSEIRALEQKLQTLNTEKQKVVQNDDAESVKKLEKQIQEIKKQIEQLRNREKNQQEERATEKMPGDPINGRYIDERI